jgi:hypothetical protein
VTVRIPVRRRLRHRVCCTLVADPRSLTRVVADQRSSGGRYPVRVLVLRLSDSWRYSYYRLHQQRLCPPAVTRPRATGGREDRDVVTAEQSTPFEDSSLYRDYGSRCSLAPSVNVADQDVSDNIQFAFTSRLPPMIESPCTCSWASGEYRLIPTLPFTCVTTELLSNSVVVSTPLFPVTTLPPRWSRPSYAYLLFFVPDTRPI